MSPQSSSVQAQLADKLRPLRSVALSQSCLGGKLQGSCSCMLCCHDHALVCAWSAADHRAAQQPCLNPGPCGCWAGTGTGCPPQTAVQVRQQSALCAGMRCCAWSEGACRTLFLSTSRRCFSSGELNFWTTRSAASSSVAPAQCPLQRLAADCGACEHMPQATCEDGCGVRQRLPRPARRTALVPGIDGLHLRSRWRPVSCKGAARS